MNMYEFQSWICMCHEFTGMSVWSDDFVRLKVCLICIIYSVSSSLVSVTDTC